MNSKMDWKSPEYSAKLGKYTTERQAKPNISCTISKSLDSWNQHLVHTEKEDTIDSLQVTQNKAVRKLV